MKVYNLFLDDVRMPIDCIHYIRNSDYANLNWVIVRTHDEFVNEVTQRFANNEFPAIVSFDHDLADEHYDPAMYHGEDAYINASVSFKEKTGLDSAKWFVQFCIDNDVNMPSCLVHSMNPIGAKRIKETLLDYDRFKIKFQNK
jgi:hypothetical protein